MTGSKLRDWPRIIVLSGLAVWTAILLPLHDRLPMWVEGMPAYVDQLLTALDRGCAPAINTVRLGGLTIPLNIDAYQGPLNTYLDLPVAHAWLTGASGNVYAYRYKGIVLLGVCGYLLFALLRRVSSPRVAALMAFVFVTLPVNVVCALGDLQYHVALFLGVLAETLAFVRYLETRRAFWLNAASALGGFALWTRAEALIWPAAAAVTFALLFRRAALRAWWRETPRKGRLAVGAVVSFALGAAPVVVFNLLYPESRLVGFLLRGSAARGASGRLLETLAARAEQFLGFILLNTWGLYQTFVSDWPFLVAFFATAVVVAVSWWKRRRVSFPLAALVIVLPLTVLAHRGPREIHLMPLTIAVVAVIAEGLSLAPLKRIGSAAAATLVVANVVALGLVDRDWRSLARSRDSLLTHSDPLALASKLEPHRGEAIYFTNIGLYQEAVWASRGQVCGANLLHWGDDAGFAAATRAALALPGGKVFVAFPQPREDALVTAGRALPRTRKLTQVLRRTRTEYSTEQIAGPSGRVLYELYVAAPAASSRPPY